MSGKHFYILVCRVCDPDLEAPIPFGSPEERGLWAARHADALDHDEWFVADQFISDQGALDVGLTS